MSQAQAWEQFNANKAKTNYPQWPNEAMLKLVFGSYLKHKIALKDDMRVLDIGCGFGNNLLPFLVRGYRCSGTEVTQDMAGQTKTILKERGFDTDIRFGTNRSLPFADNSFDLLLSINVIHYEANRKNVEAAFREYARVLDKGGRLVLMTVGPTHAILKEAKQLEPHVYQIQNYDFRDGTCFYGFDCDECLHKCLETDFKNVETGRIQESLMQVQLDFWAASAESKK